jgi:MtrB/PioB family decaheme-associated outer membrane protein
MKRNSKRMIRLPAIFLSAALLPFVASAQDDPFFLEDVPEVAVEPILDNFIEGGIGYLDDDATAFGKYSGLTDKGVEPLIDFRLQSWPEWDGDSTVFWRVEGRRVGQESRRLEATAGQQGTQRLRLGYREMPNRRFDDGRTVFDGVGSTFLGLPPTWEAGTPGSTANMPVLEESLRGVAVGHKRRRLDVGYERTLPQGFGFNLDYRRETKEGTRAIGGTIGNSGGNRRSAILPAPVDFVTDIVDATLEYTGDRVQVGVGFHGSFFRNERDSVTWQNPFGQVGGWADNVGYPDGLGRLALEPDNSFYQGRVFGGFDITPTTRLTGQVAFGRMRQNQRFLPYTVNPFLEALEPLPRQDLDGRIDTTLVDLRLTSRPLPELVPGLSLSAGLRYDDRDNRTPQDVFRPVRGDSQDQVAADSGRINLPYSFTELKGSVEARYRPFRRTTLLAGYERSEIDRDFQEVTKTTEDTFRVGARVQPVDIASLSATYTRAERNSDLYVGTRPFAANHVPGAVDPDDPLDFENHPLLRKFHLADRDRDQVSLRADVFPIPELTLGGAVVYSRDDYKNSVFGLNESRVQAYAIDVGVFPIPELSVTAFYNHDRFNTDQSGRSFRGGGNRALDVDNPDRDWFVDTRDRINTVGLNVELNDIGQRLDWVGDIGLTGKLDLGFDVIHARSRSRMDVTSGPAFDTEPLPDLSTRLNSFGVYGRYQITPAASVRLGFVHERYSSRDFALEGVDPDTVGNVLGLGQASPRYKVNWVTVGVAYRW